ncbi:hypothetical protein ACF09H_41535 [Streptomyces sp. NPDC014983]|uniref:hypothetical protein n=1 Tax=Streptomyces sp. NPDC014983 TaxID=3364933 RepID=UPI0036F8D1A6
MLGAGGSLGAAWMIGALCALQDADGWDPRTADVILGTSAGSWVRCWRSVCARLTCATISEASRLCPVLPARSVWTMTPGWVARFLRCPGWASGR